MSDYFQIVHKRKGLKKLVKKVIWLQAYSAVSGIWKNEGRQNVEGNSGKSKIKLAKLASVLEEFATWIQPKTVVLPSALDPKEKVILMEGHRYSRPPRPFIMLWKVNEAWENIRQQVRRIIVSYLENRAISGGKTGSKHILDEISRQMQNMQQDRITSISNAPNSPITQALKGFDYALFHTGRLLNSIRGKSKPNTRGRANNQEQKLKYLTQIDELMQQLNGK